MGTGTIYDIVEYAVTSVYFVISKRDASENSMCLGFDHYNCLKSDINMWVMTTRMFNCFEVNYSISSTSTHRGSTV
jgi:hypothetical protein